MTEVFVTIGLTPEQYETFKLLGWVFGILLVLVVAGTIIQGQRKPKRPKTGLEIVHGRLVTALKKRGRIRR